MQPTDALSPTGQRNFNLGVINGVLYIIAETLLDPTLVLVAFLSTLTDSPILLGLLLPIRDGGWALPQLWVSTFVQSLPYKMVVYRRMAFFRIASWAVMALAINFIRHPTWLLVVFFTAFSVGAVSSGISGLPFLEVVSKTVPARLRGGFFALRFGIGGLFGIGASLVVRWLIDPAGPMAYPHNFGFLAAIWFVLSSVSLLLYNGVVEPPDTHLLPRASFGRQVKRALQIVRTDASYRRFIFMQAMLLLGNAATPFFAVYVQQELGGPKEMVAVYLGVTVTFNLVANIIFGRVSYRLGNRAVMRFATLSGAAMSALVLALALLSGPLDLSPQAASYWLIPVFALVGIRGTAVGVSGNSLLLELAAPEERSLYVGFTQSLLGIVLIITSLSGVVVALLGFLAVISLTFFAQLAAIGAALRISRKP